MDIRQDIMAYSYFMNEIQRYQDLRPSPEVVFPIDDKPLIIPFGLPYSGKSMLMKRLHWFLLCNNMCDGLLYPCSIKYVSCQQNQNTNEDDYLKDLCGYLERCLYQNEPPYSRWHGREYSYMLTFCNPLNGGILCHIVDLPGEAFNLNNSSVWWTKYRESLMAASNKKIWLFLIEKDGLENQQKRDEYTLIINRMVHNMSPKDEAVFVFNKADLYINRYGKEKSIDIMHFMRDIMQQYPNLFDRYKNKGLSRFFKGEYSFNYTFFSSGVFTNARYIGMDDVWTPSPDIYCKNLWKKLKALL